LFAILVFVSSSICRVVGAGWRSKHLVLLALGLLAGGCLAAGEDSQTSSAGADPQPAISQLAGVRLRLMAGNLTSGSQTYSTGEGSRIFKGIAPDVAMVQEFRYGNNTAADFRTFVDTAFGPDYTYYRGASGNIPNGVVSRYPILSSGDWVDTRVADRAFTWARIDIPGPTNLWAISVHLLTSSSANRQAEAQALVALINANVPAADWVAIGGDFNTSARTEAAVTTFASVVTTSGPYPADRNGDGDTNASRAKPYDWVIVSPGLSALSTATVIGGSVFPAGLVADTRVYSPISEIAPALASDSAAPSMQHMGVVRDFDIPSALASIRVDAPNGGEQWTIASPQLIRWTASNVASFDIDYSLDGTSYSRIASGVSGTSWQWTVPAPATSAARIRISSGTSTDTSDAAFSIVTGGGGGAGQVILNEILANEPGSNVAGEFVELINRGTASVDLSGWTISDSALTRHTFATGTTVAAGARQLVYASASGIPVGVTAIAASTGQLGLSNSGDTVTLTDGNGVTIDAFSYSSSLSGSDGVSMNRSPDGSTSGFVLHTALSASSSSPGTAPQ
jgi:endonuclease/exonuclease/phosphatase family metal-dependent hydrolase